MKRDESSYTPNELTRQADDEDDGDAMADAFKAEIEKKQKVQEAVYAYVALHWKPHRALLHSR